MTLNEERTKERFNLPMIWTGPIKSHVTEDLINLVIFILQYFTVMHLVAKPLIWSEAESDLVVIETSI